MNIFSHRQIRNLIQSGEPLTNLERRIIRRHLADCDECRAFASSVGQVSAQLGGLFDGFTPTQDGQNKLNAVVSAEVELRTSRQRLLAPLRAVLVTGLAVAFVYVMVFTIEHFMPEADLPEESQFEPAQEIEAPVGPGSHVIYSGDLDCNGHPEEVIADWDYVISGGESSLQIIKVSMESNEYSAPLIYWEKPNSSPNVEYFIRPQVMEIDECNHILLLQVKGPGAGRGYVEAYAWKNNKMELVLSAKGWLTGLGSDQYRSRSGRCPVEVYTYAWNGTKFIPIAISEKTIRCQLD